MVEVEDDEASLVGAEREQALLHVFEQIVGRGEEDVALELEHVDLAAAALDQRLFGGGARGLAPQHRAQDGVLDDVDAGIAR